MNAANAFVCIIVMPSLHLFQCQNAVYRFDNCKIALELLLCY